MYLAISVLYELAPVVMSPVMIVASRDNLTTLDHDGTESEDHRAFGGRIGTL